MDEQLHINEMYKKPRAFKISKLRFSEIMTQNKSVCIGVSKRFLPDCFSKQEFKQYFDSVMESNPTERTAYRTAKELIFSDGSRLRIGGEKDCHKTFYKVAVLPYQFLIYHCHYVSDDGYASDKFLNYIVKE